MRIDTDIPGHPCEILVYHLTSGSVLTGLAPAQLRLPQSARVTAIVRDGAILDPAIIAGLQQYDYVHILIDSSEVAHLDQMFTSIEYTSAQDFFGNFILDADAKVADIAGLYGFYAVPGVAEKTIRDYLTGLFNHTPVIGDRTRFDNIELVVREIDHGKITRVGLKIRR